MAACRAMARSTVACLRDVRPMLATSAARLREGEHWSYELKWGGYRTLAGNSLNGAGSRAASQGSSSCSPQLIPIELRDHFVVQLPEDVDQLTARKGRSPVHTRDVCVYSPDTGREGFTDCDGQRLRLWVSLTTPSIGAADCTSGPSRRPAAVTGRRFPPRDSE